MDWTHADEEVAGLIARLREDQRAQVRISEAAAAIVERCHRRLREDADEISQLERECLL